MHGILGKARLTALLAAAVSAWLAGCGDTPGPAALPALSPPSPESSGCGERGYLRTNLYGELSGPVDWADGTLDCEGMPRPEGKGARLRFAGQFGEHSLAILVAMPGLQRGVTARELDSNVTLIEEGGGRFFSTAGLGSCWTDVPGQERLGEDDYFVAGTLYCIAPLAEINGDSSVTLRELEFGGYLNWGAK